METWRIEVSEANEEVGRGRAVRAMRRLRAKEAMLLSAVVSLMFEDSFVYNVLVTILIMLEHGNVANAIM